MTNNLCGSCNACCRVYAIPALDKPAGKWCENCDVGKGCRIYETRPETCSSFECLWLQSHRYVKLAEELRPDRCKVVFTSATRPDVMVATTMPGSPDAWQRTVVRRLIGKLLLGGLTVSVGPPNSKTQTLLTPDGKTQIIEMSEPDENGIQWSKT